MALDPAYFFYSDGTITLTNGSDIATGEFTAWDPAVLPFDFVFPNNGTDGMTVIKEVLAMDQIRLAQPWTGPTLTDVPYFMVRWTKHTDPKVYALRLSDYLARLKSIPENLEEVAGQINDDRQAIDAALTTITQAAADVEAGRSQVAANTATVTEAVPLVTEARDEAVAARDVAVSIVGAQSALWDTRSAAAAANIPTPVQYLRTAGYAVVGDGGDALYKRLGIGPGTPQAWHFQSADGAWWELAESSANVLMFGASPSKGAAQNQVCFQNALNFGRDAGIDVFVPAGDYELDPITVENVRLYGAGSQDVGYDTGTPSIDDMGRGGTQLRITHTTVPAVSLRWGSTLEGVTFYYPYQTKANFDANSHTPVIYPPTVHVDSNMVNVRIRNIGMVNAYIGVRVGDTSLNGQASGRVYIEGLLGYCIKTGVEIFEARDIVMMSNVVLSYAHWNGTEVGAPVTANTIAWWTYRNGAVVRANTVDGLFVDNCFFFCYRKGIEVSQSASSTLPSEASPGLLQFCVVSNTLFDGTPQMLHVTDGGWLTTAAFSNCVVTNLGASPFDNSGEYPESILFDSFIETDGRLLINNVYFSGAPGRFITVGGNSLSLLSVSNCDFFASHRAAGSLAAAAPAMIYIAPTPRKIRATFDNCTFDGTASNGVSYAVAIENAKAISINGGQMAAFVQPLYINVTDFLTVSGLTTTDTSGPNSVGFAGGFAGKVSLEANLDKPPNGYAFNRPYAVAKGFPGAIAPTGTVLTFGVEEADVTGALSAASGTFTCPTNGRYRVALQIAGTVAAGDTWRFDLQINGSPARSVLAPIATSGLQSLPLIEFEILGLAGQTFSILGSRFDGAGTFGVIGDDAFNRVSFELVP
jgi:hypothetical protein